MYREPYKKKQAKSFRYKCGAYMQSHGAVCTHNHIDGPLTTRSLLKAVSQRLGSPRLRALIEEKLRELAGKAQDSAAHHAETSKVASELSEAQQQIDLAQRNLARAKSDEQYSAIAKEFDRLKQQEKNLNGDLQQLNTDTSKQWDPQAEIQAALGLVGRLTELADRGDDYSAARELFDLVNARMFFGSVPKDGENEKCIKCAVE
jgi:chromosome segregation ATPase